ncbi:MAG: 16S rRNA (adenine(1518)-N(6)/adenine(1519)-N(6))-dimethyltransferase [Clostridiales bacterium]|jgi:16S rRNA A1518/A1519 N6-dimethyltransferase RsmA/KsgA/DIM1 with predicted DNA glycosylase/AP lyase activity|nr:16S rRNA (adenine(1518)-N(6)/adenine(1519)-N(6))-dimethyltransferase [Clostridiales bacterium]
MDLRQSIKSGDIRPAKTLGQNFLADRNIAGKIVAAAELCPGDHVIEVGPGLGALTGLLCERAGFVTAVEIDRHLLPTLRERLSAHRNVRVIHGDILKIPLAELLEAPGPGGAEGSGPGVAGRGDRPCGSLHCGLSAVASGVAAGGAGRGDRPCDGPDGHAGNDSNDHAGNARASNDSNGHAGNAHASDAARAAAGAGNAGHGASAAGAMRLKLVSNLPYYISTPIMMRFFEEGAGIEKMVLMMQKEVAARLTARPSTKAYGSLTVAAGYYAAPRLAFSVSPRCFVPQPGVESAVVVLDAKAAAASGAAGRARDGAGAGAGGARLSPEAEAMFFRVVKAAFAQRRKTLENCLIQAGLLPPEREAAARALAAPELGLTPGIRGEALDLNAFMRLAAALAGQAKPEPQ